MHLLDQTNVVEHQIFTTKGRPKTNAIADKVAFQVIATVKTDDDATKALIEQKSCFVLATNVSAEVLNANDVNAALYGPTQRKDEVMWTGYRVQNLFNDNLPIELKKNLVIAYSIIANPFEMEFSARLELSRSLDLKINERKYQIPQTSIFIRYYSYDLKNNEVGEEKIPKNGFVAVGGTETVIAKFILRREFPIRGVKNPKRSFWRSFLMELEFTKSGEEFPLVDGVKLITAHPQASSGENEFAVPWGNSHEIRRRSGEPRRR